MHHLNPLPPAISTPLDYLTVHHLDPLLPAISTPLNNLTVHHLDCHCPPSPPPRLPNHSPPQSPAARHLHPTQSPNRAPPRSPATRHLHPPRLPNHSPPQSPAAHHLHPTRSPNHSPPRSPLPTFSTPSITQPFAPLTPVAHHLHPLDYLTVHHLNPHCPPSHHFNLLLNSDHPSPISPGHHLVSPILSNVVNNVLNKFIFILNSGSPILWTEPGSQGLGSAKEGPNLNRTGPQPVYVQPTPNPTLSTVRWNIMDTWQGV